MRGALTANAVLVAVTLFNDVAQADLCQSGGSELINGNWYCQPVQRITYEGVGGRGTYNKVTHMDSKTGECASTPQTYSGSMSPLDEDVSLHIRGPFTLKQLAVYKPSTAAPTPDPKAKRSIHHRRHGHAHFHEKKSEMVEKQKRADADKEKREWITATINGDVVSWEDASDGGKAKAPATTGDGKDWVTATINGNVVSWINDYAGSAPAAATSAPVPSASVPSAPVPSAPASSAPAPSAPAPSAPASLAPAPSAPAPAPIANNRFVPANGYIGPADSLTTTLTSTVVRVSPTAAAAPGDWEQISYYNSDNAKLTKGFTFLNNNGGQGSGVFD